MQEALLALTEYWTRQGCIISQPMNTEVGAGTLNPATFLRVLGPEPWRVAYVEPSVRPDDARYGDNPNRIQTHTQFQVILKPEPGDAQELYLGSLAALGVDARRHDVRFVEDNWASPALGAWGLGWEVWLDGLEITQFTYFQQAGGLNLDPVSVEITYGVERIMMALQGVRHFKDIGYAPGVSYGEVYGQSEYEMSVYYLDKADVATNRSLFEEYAAEARRMLEAGLPVPAHSYVLKCSHAFNVLDSRGAISPTERAAAFARMRGLARDVAVLWSARREELGYPLGRAASTTPLASTDPAEERPATSPATLVVEIGVEELPPAEVTRAREAVEAALNERLSAGRLRHGAVRVVASPRRVVAVVDQVQPVEDDHTQTVRGPRTQSAYDAEGAPTRALLGFARGQGIDPAKVRTLYIDGSEYVAVVRDVPGRPAAEVLSELLSEVIAGLRADKNMRWNAPGLSYARPIRWILALLGGQVVPVAVSTIEAGRQTRVNRMAAHPVVDVPAADGYLDLLDAHGIQADQYERERIVREESLTLADGVSGTIDLEGEAALVAEIVNLVEQPAPLLGRFDPTYLELPADVLTTVMRKHQRYLPVRGAGGDLLAAFVAVANGPVDADVVRAGNEAVLRARYEDAVFFWRKDLEKSPPELHERLARLTFAEGLGSVADRAARLARIATDLAGEVDLDPGQRATLTEAAAIAKFDLGSQMVTELSSLAGVMAREYAQRAGYPEPVAEALFEMELPRQAGDRLPVSTAGALLALADRLDLLTGLVAVRSLPTGSSDPFGLRRAALGIVNILRAHPELEAVTLPAGLEVAGRHQPVEVTDTALADAQDFVVRRFEQLLLEAGHPVAHVRAVLPLAVAPGHAERVLAELDKLADQEDFRALVAAIDRVRRIVPEGTPTAFDPSLLTEPAEQHLHQALARLRAELPGATTPLAAFVTAAQQLVPAIEQLFTDVLVMADDPAVRSTRLSLLAVVLELAAPVLAWREVA